MAHAGSLSAAAATGDLAQIHNHMANGGFIDERDTHLNTPLHHACLAGNRSAVELLLSYGADVNAENMQGKSTLQFAGHSGDTVILRRLLEAGADAKHQSHDGKTALLSSIVNDFPEAARILIEAGCEVDLAENEGNTPLHKAAQKDFPVCVELLRSYGANQWVRNDAGKTPIDIAREAGFNDVLEALLDPPLPRSHWDIFDHVDHETAAAPSTAVPAAVTQVQQKNKSVAPASASPSQQLATAAAAAASAAVAAAAAANSHQSQFAPQARATTEQSALDTILTQPGVPHRTLFDFTGTRPDELTFVANQPILVLKRFDDGWCLGEHNDLIGMFPAKYALLETRPRHSHTALVVKPSRNNLPEHSIAVAAAESAIQATPPMVAAPPTAATPSTSSPAFATEATASSKFAQSDTRVRAANAVVRVSEGAVLEMLEKIERVRLREAQPFLDSVPTMAAAAARAYDTSLRSVQLLAKMALAINNVTPSASQVLEAHALNDSMLQVTTSWIQTRQSLVDDGKNVREAISVPLSTQLAETARTCTTARRAMAVYGRLLAGKVEQLEAAGSDAAASASAAEGLERAVKFVAERHTQIKESLHWRLGSMLAALLNGWRAWADIEFHLQSRSVTSLERLQATLEAIDVPDTPLPDSEWENETNS